LQEKQTPATSGSSRIKVVLAALVIILFSAAATYVCEHSKGRLFGKVDTPQGHTREVTITGEVVDAWCYASQTMGAGRGEGHKACALACSYGGVSMGILEDGTNQLYVAAKYKGYHGCNELLIPYVAQKVKVTGWVGDLGGCRMLKIRTVTPLEEPKIEP